MYRHRLMVLLAAVTLGGCTDRLTSPLEAPNASASERQSNEGFAAIGDFQRYVAIGTSISMGVQSAGVNAVTQQASWPAQLARLARRELALPLIEPPGCPAPFAAPLTTFSRLSGESVGLPLIQAQCSPNEAGVVLPTGNVAIDGARTLTALSATPENPDPSHAPQYPRVLPPGMSQVTAMESQNPKIVSVELGGNDILGARAGVYPSATEVVTLADWEPVYREVVARVAATTKHAVLVGLVNDVRSFPSFRTGNELWNAAITFAPFNVAISADCQNSTNLLFVPQLVPFAVAMGAYYSANNFGPFPFSCANYPSSTNISDFVLDAGDVAGINAQLAGMNAVIQDEAQKHGFAYFPLGALYEGVVTKAPYSAITQMTTSQPYGPYISLDGIHPSAAGQLVLANAAADALNTTYRLGIPSSTGTLALVRQ